jgi:hypothetical protein
MHRLADGCPPAISQYRTQDDIVAGEKLTVSFAK